MEVIFFIYNAGSRKVTITALIEMQQYLEDDEDELRELTDNAVKKLSKLMMSSMKDQTCSRTSKTETPVN